MSNQTKNYNLNYLIDSTFTNVNRLFHASITVTNPNNDAYDKKFAFKNIIGNENDRTSFSKYYVPKVEIKDFNVLIDGKPFFEIPVKNKEETYEAIMTIIMTVDYTTGNLLDYEYFSKHYKLIAIDLSKQTELENPALKQQISFTGRLGENNATMFFIIEKKEETLLIFHKIL